MKNITIIAAVFCMMLSYVSHAQVTETFESFTLTPNFFYQDNNGTDWRPSITKPATFEYGWKNNTWTSGSVYTNIHDTTDKTLANLYACSSYSAFDGSNYVTAKDSAKIYLENTPTFINNVSGFFITNTTYVKNALKNGTPTSRKFGDTTGTGWGAFATQGTYPDWLKLIVTGYYNGLENPNHVEIYLADYRPGGTANDFIVSDWRYVNCVSVGPVDSIQLMLISSDINSAFKMKTPGYFSIDRFTTTNNVGIHELENIVNITVSPNPTSQNLNLSYSTISESQLNINVYDISGKEVMVSNNVQNYVGQHQLELETEKLDAGIYFVNVSNGISSKKIKFIKL
jgi:hypothetical protein